MANIRPSASLPNKHESSNRASRRQPEQRVFVGIPDAATYLDVDHKTIRWLITSGKLPAYRLGNRVIKIRVTDLDSVLTPLGGAV
jgi:excisionase family DNA binding protein